ncbi:ribosome biogenesis GTPase YqeH [Babesia caballi]|uniref:Ribosome biogenesis GTPase YqeH n=1 Tax=Babesia caballi TaxID=5871 RepID=A0AAV4LVE8_BABCB|nr:ribosome biogenesis GTPase YqeH [Babesia caballi]
MSSPVDCDVSAKASAAACGCGSSSPEGLGGFIRTCSAFVKSSAFLGVVASENNGVDDNDEVGASAPSSSPSTDCDVSAPALGSSARDTPPFTPPVPCFNVAASPKTDGADTRFCRDSGTVSSSDDSLPLTSSFRADRSQSMADVAEAGTRTEGLRRLAAVVDRQLSGGAAGGATCFAFYKGGRRPRRPRRSPLTPEENSRLAQLERELAQQQPQAATEPTNDFHFDRGLGSSYSSFHRTRTDEAVPGESISQDDTPRRLDSKHVKSHLRYQVELLGDGVPGKSEDIAYRGEHDHRNSGKSGNGFKQHASDDGLSDLLDESLRAAEQWECNADRFRNQGEILDNITDEEMMSRARQVQLEESHESTSLKELLTKSGAQRVKATTGEWKGLVQQFEIGVDSDQCVGCGIPLQCGNPSQQGFVESAALQGVRALDGKPRCQRCASMRSGLIYRDGSVALGESATAAARETVAILRNALSVNATRHVTVVYMMDALDMHFERGLAELITSRREQRSAETRLYVALNKVDLLPPHSRKRLIMYVHRFIQSRAPSLRLKPRHVFLMSSRTGGGVNLFLSVLLDAAYRARSKVFFIGATNTGKSTFINRLSGFVATGGATPKKRQLLSTSVIPGTTLRPLRIDAGPGFNLYDTPGIVVRDALTSYLTASELKVAVPASLGPLRPLRIGAGYSLLLGPFVRIDVLAGRPFFFTPYLSKHVSVAVKRTHRLSAFLSKQPFGDSRVFYSSEAAPVQAEQQTIDWSSASGATAEESHDGGITDAPDIVAEEPVSMEPPNLIMPNDGREILGSIGDSSAGNAGGTISSTPPPTAVRHVHIIGDGWERATADLCIKGMGFVGLSGALKLLLRVETLQGVTVYMREPLMPFDGIPFRRRKLPRKPSD